MSGAAQHAQAQLLERYGLNTPIAYLAERIRAGKAEYVSVTPVADRTVWLVPDTNENGETVQVKCIYSRLTGFVITVLPPKYRYEIAAQRAAQQKKSFARQFRRMNGDENDF